MPPELVDLVESILQLLSRVSYWSLCKINFELVHSPNLPGNILENCESVAEKFEAAGFPHASEFVNNN